MKRDILDALNEARRARRPAVLVRPLPEGDQSLLIDGDLIAGPALDETLRQAARTCLRLDKGVVVESGGAQLFVQPFNPPLQLFIVGAVHIAQSLVPMARLAGYAVTVIDPRRAFASDERFPDVTISTAWPDEALEPDTLTSRSALVTLTHDPKIDDPALEVGLRSDAFYIAALGSKKTHAGRIERLREAGFDPPAIGRIHGPAGLKIGAVSPAEIALSVMAQMTAVLRQGEA